jgi:hypothetical protein
LSFEEENATYEMTKVIDFILCFCNFLFLISSFSIFSNFFFFHILSFMQKKIHFGEQDGTDDGAIDVIVFIVVVSKST